MPGPSDQDCVVVLETAAASGAKSKKPYAAAASGDFTASGGAGPSSILAKQVQLNRSLDLTSSSSANPRQQNLLH
jgi:hypothetical protein